MHSAATEIGRQARWRLSLHSSSFGLDAQDGVICARQGLVTGHIRCCLLIAYMQAAPEKVAQMLLLYLCRAIFSLKL